MKKLSLFCALLFCILGSSKAALADTFQFSFSGLLFSGTGYLYATEVGSSNNYNVTAVFGGSVTSGLGTSAITGILADNTFQGNDNILIFPGTFGFNSPKFFNPGGVSFALKDGSDINLNDTLLFENSVGSAGPLIFTQLNTMTVIKASPAPEPSGLILLGTGILGACGAVRRRFNV